MITDLLISSSYNVFINNSFDTLRPVVKFSYPIQRAFTMKENGNVSFMYPEYSQTRSQDLETAYHDAGLFYWGTVAKGFRGNMWGGFEIDENYCQDIDTESDWIIAEIKYKALHNQL